ncbi:MAG TPA: glycine cleavage system aminomethyltransferase GcvT [Salinimicrobium sp.]|nr:glycine cleavage system aminomethyltransferase GcvT [Salinimicrobium sp.]
MRNTALTAIHEELGAKIVPFAGFRMPVSYEGVNIEHHTVRNAVGVFDVSHMGEFLVSGKHALELLQKVCSNDISKLVDGKAQYNCMPNENGGIVDDLIVYRFNEEKYFLVVNASNIEKDWDWLCHHNTMNATLADLSEEYSLLAVQGPKAAEAMQSLTQVDLSNMDFYSFQVAEFAGVEQVIISATGYTGSGGFEIYIKNENAKTVWDRVMEAGEAYGIKPIGLAARDTLRLEMGYCLYGNDIDETTSPIEAGLGWITKFTKDFINSEAIKKYKEEGPARKLIAFELNERGIPRQGYEIADAEGKIIGNVTSGTMSPSLEKGIGLGYVSTEFSAVGTNIFINVRKNSIPATVVKPPFYKG